MYRMGIHTVPYCTVLYRVPYCTTYRRTVLYCIVPYCTVYRTILYRTVLYCTVLYRTYCTIIVSIHFALTSLNWHKYRLCTYFILPGSLGNIFVAFVSTIFEPFSKRWTERFRNFDSGCYAFSMWFHANILLHAT